MIAAYVIYRHIEGLVLETTQAHDFQEFIDDVLPLDLTAEKGA